MPASKKEKKKEFSLEALVHRFKTLALLAGFFFDLYVLPPINTGRYLWVGPTYILTVFFCIFMRQLFRRFINYGSLYILFNFYNFAYNFFTFFTSFFLGSLLAYSLIYYSSLSDIISVWPILVLILIAIILNETLKDKIFDVVIFMLAINFYFILNTPIFFLEVSNTSFYFSLFLAFLVNIIIIKMMKWIYHEVAHNFLYTFFLFLIPLLIYGLHTLKYFPAVPLKLGESGFYSYIEKVDNGISLEYYKEKRGETVSESFLGFFKEPRIEKNKLDNEKLYFFSSVIAPRGAAIKSIISHSWEKWNSRTKGWEKKFIFNFPIFGDRVDGYRGYSVKSNIETGEWRVRVLSDSRIIGVRKVLIY